MLGRHHPDGPPSKIAKRKRLLLVVGLLLIVGIGITRLTAGLFSEPASGKVVVGAAQPNHSGFEVDLTPTAYNGKAFSFRYPVGLQSKPTSPLAGPDIAKASFGAKDLISWNLEIDVTNDGGQPLSSNAAYSYRQQHPDLYQAATITTGGQTATVMTDKTAAGFSKVAFLQSGDRRATVSLLGDDAQGTAPLQTTFTMVLDSWQWQ